MSSRFSKVLLAVVGLLVSLSDSSSAAVVDDLTDERWENLEAGGAGESALVLFYSRANENRDAATTVAQFRAASEKLSSHVLFGTVECAATPHRARLAALCQQQVGDGVAIVALTPRRGGKKASVKKYAGGRTEADMAKFASTKLLSDALVSSLGPANAPKGASIFHHVKVTDFLVRKATLHVPKALFFVTRGSLGKVPVPPMVKALSQLLEGRMLVAVVSPAQLDIRRMFLERAGQNLAPPAVLVLPAGAATAGRAVAFDGAALTRSAVQAFLEPHALERPNYNIHAKAKAQTHKVKVRRGSSGSGKRQGKESKGASTLKKAQERSGKGQGKESTRTSASERNKRPAKRRETKVERKEPKVDRAEL